MEPEGWRNQFGTMKPAETQHTIGVGCGDEIETGYVEGYRWDRKAMARGGDDVMTETWHKETARD